MSLSRQSWFTAALAATTLVPLGCNYVFHAAPEGADATTVDAQRDAMPVPPRLALNFGSAQTTQIPGDNPSVSDDGLHLWFERATTPIDRDIIHAQRIAANQNFNAPVQLNINTAANEIDAAITADQLLVTFASDFQVAAGGGFQIYQARRQSSNLEFEPYTKTNLSFPAFKGFDASPDGLQIFFADGGFLRSNVRTTRDELYAVGPAASVVDPNISYPTVSFDRLELIYVDADGKHLARALLSPDGKSYGAPQPLDVGVTCGKIAGPDLSPNAMSLTFFCDDAIYIARRPMQ